MNATHCADELCILPAGHECLHEPEPGWDFGPEPLCPEPLCLLDIGHDDGHLVPETLA